MRLLTGIKIVICGTLAVLFIPSCTHPLVGYVTSTQNVPLLNDKLQAQMAGTISFNHVEALTAFSPIKYCGVVTNFYGGTSGRNLEAGIGGYIPINSKFLFEAYALRVKGDLHGKTTSTYAFVSENVDADLRRIDAKYWGYSMQCDFGYKLMNKEKFNFGVGVGTKYAVVDYDHYVFEKKHYERWQSANQSGGVVQYDSLTSKRLKFLNISPTIFFGSGPVYLFGQVAYHLSLDGYLPALDQFPMYKKIWITTGIQFRMGEGLLKFNDQKQDASPK